MNRKPILVWIRLVVAVCFLGLAMTSVADVTSDDYYTCLDICQGQYWGCKSLCPGGYWNFICVGICLDRLQRCEAGCMGIGGIGHGPYEKY
jgi:hypothetical protein